MSEVLESWGNSENKLYAFILQIVIVYDDSELGLPRIFRWARHEAWLQGALIWWGWVGIKIYNSRKLIFKGPIFYLKPWKRPRMLLYLKKNDLGNCQNINCARHCWLPTKYASLSPLSEVPDFIPARLPPLQSPVSQAGVDTVLGSRGISRFV